MTPPATALYLAGLVISEALRLPLRIRRSRSGQAWRQAGGRARPIEILVLVAVALGIWILPIAYAFTGQPQALDYSLPPPMTRIAAFVFLLSLIIRWRAQKDLSTQWSSTLETSDVHQLVRNGIYAHIRHPIYASLVLWAAAQPILLQNVAAGLGGPIAVALIWLIRVPQEEKMMIERFGEQYRQYAAKTGRLFPKPKPRD